MLNSGAEHLRHPVIGELELRRVVLRLADDPERKVITFAAAAKDQVKIAELIGPGRATTGRYGRPRAGDTANGK